MAIILDDGSFEIGNSFVIVSDIEEYAELRAESGWTGNTSNDAKEAAAIRAFDYFKIISWSSTAFASGIPVRIKEAQIKAAIKELTSPGVMQPTEESNIKRKRIEGAIETEYFEASRFTGKIHNDILNLIKPYLAITESTIRSTRHLVRR